MPAVDPAAVPAVADPAAVPAVAGGSALRQPVWLWAERVVRVAVPATRAAAETRRAVAGAARVVVRPASVPASIPAGTVVAAAVRAVADPAARGDVGWVPRAVREPQREAAGLAGPERR